MLLQGGNTEEVYESLRRKQIIVWVFLLLLVAVVVGGIFSIAYQVLKSDGGERSGGLSSFVVTPLAGGDAQIEGKGKERKDHFIFGELSSADETYRLYRVSVQPLAKEELFSFPWDDRSSLPTVTAQGGYLGVFFEPGKGYLLDHEGKLVGLNALPFVPPYAYFAISPDGTRMVYFKYFSSVGTTSAMVRDLKTNEDVFAWPIGSEASVPCTFTGWSADGRKAYCVAYRGTRAEARAYDVKSFSYALVGTAANAAQARYWPDHGLLISAGTAGVSVFDAAKKTRKTIASIPAENALLVPSGQPLVFFTAENAVYAVGLEGGDPRKVADDARLAAVSADGTLLLLARENGKRFSAVGVSGSDSYELFALSQDIAHAEFVGWFAN